MSRLWDTPEFWVRTETDELLRDYPATDVSALAGSLELTGSNYDGDAEFARQIVVELRKRAAANVRFWPVPSEMPFIEGEIRELMVAEAAGAQPEAWWQRM